MTGRNDGSDAATVLDARLVPCALAAWAVTLLGLYTGWRIVIVVAVAAVVGCSVTVRLVATGRIPRGGARILLAALAVVAGFGPAAGLRMWAADQHPIASAAERGAWAGVVLLPTDDPRRIRAAAFDDTPRVRIPARLEHVMVGGRSMDTGGSVVVLAPADSWGDLLPGQSVTARVRAAPHTGPGTTVAVLHAENAPTVVGPPPVWQRWAGTVRDRLAQVGSAVLPADRAGLLPGLVVGDTTALTDEVREDFRVAGLTHLTAVSGDNCTLAGVCR